MILMRHILHKRLSSTSHCIGLGFEAEPGAPPTPPQRLSSSFIRPCYSCRPTHRPGQSKVGCPQSLFVPAMREDYSIRAGASCGTGTEFSAQPHTWSVILRRKSSGHLDCYSQSARKATIPMKHDDITCAPFSLRLS